MARRVLTGFVLVVLAFLGWLLAAPQQLGGPVAVVSTYGSSMLPTYEASDLVVVARAADYDVGDVVAYRSDQLNTVVLHRIVDLDEDGYITSGDNNDWLDPDRPTDEDLMGTARIRVPLAGRLLAMPPLFRATAIAALAGLALLGGSRGRTRRRRRRRGASGGVVPLRQGRRRPAQHSKDTPPDVHTGMHERTHATPLGGMPAVANASPQHMSDAVTDENAASDTTWATWVGWPAATAFVATVLAVAGAALAVLAFTSSTTEPGELGYSHRGTFDYTATAPDALVYPDGEVTTGEPVFLRLIDTLDMTYIHEFDGPTQNVHMTGRLWLELSDGSGWSHRTPLGDERETTDEPLVLENRLDIPAARRLIDRIREQTGMNGGGGDLDVVAEVEVAATLAGQEILDELSPALGFELGEQRLMPRAADDAEAGTTHEGELTVEDLDTARLELAGRGLDVPQARALAVALLVLALVALAVSVTGAVRRRGIDEAQRVRLRYGAKLIDVASLRSPPNHGVAMVRDVSALAGLADLAERPILHLQEAGVHTYIVEDETTQYRYRIDLANSVSSQPTQTTRTKQPADVGPDLDPSPAGRTNERTAASRLGIHTSDATRGRLRRKR